MRLLPPLIVAALTTLAAAAAADEPPASTPLTLSAPAAGSDLPDMGSPAAAVLSHTDEYRLGAMVARELRDQNALLEDPEVSEYMSWVGLRLASQSADGGRGFQYFVIKDPAINAFAVPGGFVFVNDGLVLATSSESELASVMAHETAHVTQHHIARMIRDQQQQSLTSAAALLAAILLGAIGGGQAIEGGIVAAQGMAAQHQINFTRDNELEADRVGIGYLAGAGFDANSMASFFETMSRHEGLAASYIPAMLIDHPVTSDRVAEARARAAQFPPRKAKDSQSYELIRERVRVLTATGDVDLAAQYAQRISRGHATVGERYGEALAQAKAGHTSEALATFRHAQELFPRNVPVTVRYAETLMAAGRPADAHDMLLDLFNNVPPTPDQIRLTALAASAAGDAGDAYFYMGEYQIAGGDLALAAQQLQLALASPNISTVQRQRYQARLDEVRDYLASTRKRRLTDNGNGQGQQTGQQRGGGR